MAHLIAGVLLLVMVLGFGLLESGFSRAKNAVHALAKNFMALCVALVVWWLWGAALATGDPGFIPGRLDGYYQCELNSYKGAICFLGGLLAVLPCAMVSGALAERVKFFPFLLFCVGLAGGAFPFVLRMFWEEGALGEHLTPDMGAGAVWLHSLGGWAALAGLLMVGPRIGKYRRDGGANALPGHNMTSVFMGGLVLWVGWFGLVAVLYLGVFSKDVNAFEIAQVTQLTALSGAVGAMSATALVSLLSGRPDFGTMILGALGGMVSLSGVAGEVSLTSGAVMALVGGVVVVLGVRGLERLKLDDPVGMVPVHLGGGLWATAAAGLFHHKAGLFFCGGWALLKRQVVGGLAVGAFVFLASLLLWFLLKITLGLRASAEEETGGLDFTQHGNLAYPDFQGQLNHLM